MPDRLIPRPGWELAIDPEDPYGPTRFDFYPEPTPKWRRIPPSHPVPTNPPAPPKPTGEWCPHRHRFVHDLPPIR